MKTIYRLVDRAYGFYSMAASIHAKISDRIYNITVIYVNHGILNLK